MVTETVTKTENRKPKTKNQKPKTKTIATENMQIVYKKLCFTALQFQILNEKCQIYNQHLKLYLNKS